MSCLIARLFWNLVWDPMLSEHKTFKSAVCVCGDISMV